MQEAGVQLVVPALLVRKFPGTVQPQLQTFESFIGDVRLVDDAVRAREDHWKQVLQSRGAFGLNRN